MRGARGITSRACLLAAAAWALCACGQNGLVIVGNQRPRAGDCALVPTDTHERIDRGTFDLAIGDRSAYVLTPLVRSRRSIDVVVESVHLTMRWDVDGEVVPLRVRGDSGMLYDEWDVDLAGCPSDCPIVPGNGASSFEVPTMPRAVTQYLNGVMDDAVAMGATPPEFRVISTVVLEGTSGGEHVVSDPFDYELRVCLGCLVTFPPDSDSPSIPGADCCGGSAPAPSCEPGQDDAIDCRTCTTTSPEICNFARLSCG